MTEDELLQRLERWLATRSKPPTVFEVIETRDGLLFAAYVSKAFHAAAVAAVEETERVIRIRAAALSYFGGDESEAETFLRSPHALLNGDTPLRAAVASQDGAEKVRTLLTR